MGGPAVGLTWSNDLVGRSSSPGENALKYLSLLVEAGMSPLLVTPGTSTHVVAKLDGLLLPGGPDIEPARYGQEAGDHLGPVVPELDVLELEFFHAARARRLPVLGICRGQQVVNVALGGTLHQHVVHPLWGGDPAQAVHEVRIDAGTLLHRFLGVDTAQVNSGHHQAADVIADPLRVCAHSADGCVEALESEELLVMTVQWHPEEMRDTPTSHLLMAGFAEWMDHAS
jgi:putative glutamine amidotransferase